jgi:hypothetical protein
MREAWAYEVGSAVQVSRSLGSDEDGRDSRLQMNLSYWEGNLIVHSDFLVG